MSNTNASGPGSLAQAFIDASSSANCFNSTPTIGFALTGTGPFTISPAATLDLFCGVGSINATLDGGTQTGSTLNTSATGFNAINQIIIDRGGGLYFTGVRTQDFGYGASLTIRGVDLRNFTYAGSGTAIEGPVNVYGSRIESSTVGIRPTEIDPDGSGSIVFGNIGSSALADRNVLRNGQSIVVSYGGHVNITGNLIGTNDAGTASGGPGTGVGISLQGPPSVNVVGNIISGANAAGILVTGASSSTIVGNKIGVTASGAALGNAGHGINAQSGSSIDIADNTIAHNGGDGINIASGSGFEIRGNRIYANAIKAINLSGTATSLPNDANDIDTGTNGLQNYPVISSVTKSLPANSTTINWSLNTTSGGNFQVDFFSNLNPGNQALVYLDPATLGFPQAGGSTGLGNFISGTTVIPGLHEHIAATATNVDAGETSEVSAAVPVVGIQLSPEILNFGNIVVGASSSPLVANLLSIGAQPYVINFLQGSSLCYGGPPPICSGGEFICTTDCTTGTPYPGATGCSIDATFAPISLGTKTEVIYICDNAGGNPRTLTLNGNAIAPPPVSITPSMHDFGSVEAGDTSLPVAFTVSNFGPTEATLTPFAVTGPYQIVSNTCTASLPAMSDCVVDLAFTPVATGPQTGTLATTASPGGASVTVTGTGVAGPPPTFTPPSIDFGSVVVGQQSASGTFIFDNPAILPLSISSSGISPQFAITGTTCGASLPGESSCAYSVAFQPTALGAITGALQVTTGGGIYSAGVSGTGVASPPPTIAPPNFDFGSVVVGALSPPSTFTISNPAPTPMSLSSFSVTPPFVLHSTTCGSSVAAGGSCTADVKFVPTAPGAASGSISATTSFGNISSGLTGNGTSAPMLTISPPSTDFGNVLVGSMSAVTTFTITNPGGTTSSVALSVVGPYQIASTTCGTSLAAAASCTAGVRFVPTATGVVTGSLVATSALGPSSANLQGNGQRMAVVDIPTNRIEFGALVQGSAPVQHPLTLRNTGNGTLGINSIAMGAPFTLTNACGSSLAAGESCILTVNFDPTTIGDFSALLSISTNAPGAALIQVPVHAAVQARPEPLVRVTPRSIGFGSRLATQPSPTQRVTINNEGGNVASLQLAIDMPHFEIATTNCGATLAAGASCFADLRFVPLGYGPKRATFAVSSNSPDSPQTVSLSGVGCRPVTGTGRGTPPNSCAP